MSRKLFEEAQKVLRQNQQPVTEAAVKLDPVGQEDKDVDNDGDSDKTDSYLKKRRGAISAAIAGSKKTMVAKESVEKPKLDEATTNKILAILGKPMQEEVVSESDLPITKKPQKTITVKHKTSEREKVIVDTPEARKRNAAMGYHPVKEGVEHEEFTAEDIENFMQTEEYLQLDELTKNLLSRYSKAAEKDKYDAWKKDTDLAGEQQKVKRLLANTNKGFPGTRHSNPISKTNAPAVHKALSKASDEIQKMRDPLQARHDKRKAGIELATKKMGIGPGSRGVVKGTGKLNKEEAEQIDEMDSQGYKGRRDDYNLGDKESVAKPISQKQMGKAALSGLNKSMDNQRRISAETMTRKQFIDVHGDEHAHVWDKVNKGMKEEAEQVDEAQSHQAITTMKHISKPTAGEMKAAKDMKPGVAGYRDRIAMLKSAEARGALKKEEAEQVDEMEVANKYALKGPQKSEVPAYMRKAKGATPLKLADLKRKDTMSDLENLRKMEEVDTAPVSEILEQVDAFTIELPEELSYEDYLRSAMFAEGVSSLSELEDDFLPSFLQYVQEKFESGDEDFVISELTYSEMQDRIYMHQKQGNKVTGVERKTVNGKPYAAYVVTDKTGMRRRYIYHGNVRRVENLGQGSASQTVKPGQTDPNEE